MRRIRRPRIDLVRGLGWAFLGVLATGVGAYIVQSQSMPALAFWHQEDFAAAVVPELDNLDEVSFAAYRAHEKKIFDALEQELQTRGADLPVWSRYHPELFGKRRERYERWNSSQLLRAETRRGAALLVHGLSDSPYSMRSLGLELQDQGMEVLNLRLPGHGTTPGALQTVEWEDWRDAYSMAARHLAADLPADQPLVLVGYSNGAALAVDYTLRALKRPDQLRVPDMLVLVSPAMRVSALAAFARVQSLVAELPGLEKLDWTGILPEYDPFKYNSFPLDAAREIYRLTTRVQGELEQMRPDARENFPPVLAFQSVVDATIAPSSVVFGLLRYLEASTSELVLFDINEQFRALNLLRSSGDPRLLRFIRDNDTSPFAITAVTNRGEDGEAVGIVSRAAGGSEWQQQPSDLVWPENIFSLSHVSLPFPPDDPLYGEREIGGIVQPGQIQFRGERGISVVPMDLLARLRYNPFYDYLEQRILDAIDSLEGG